MKVPRGPRGRFLRKEDDTPGTVDTTYAVPKIEKEQIYANN